MSKPSQLITIGRIKTVFGVKGWLKVHSYTDPISNLSHYNPWHIQLRNEWHTIIPEECRVHGQTILAKLPHCDDRDMALQYCGAEIAIERSQLPAPNADEYYWHDLEGLRVLNRQGIELGVIDYLFSSGANDIIVVQAPDDDSSASQNTTNKPRKSAAKQHLIPFIREQFVIAIDLSQRTMLVDWDPDF
ncbi:MAG: ribosome maturation factor RimM [Gammaproteobacteria bacterium]